ncbi:hypothetical protein [Paenirhodobacter sp.]|uniref:hypothetical protein n=1 Tax=Paenirhodobacter sp. TaxID=1965326 RepID=UPI003B3BECBA
MNDATGFWFRHFGRFLAPDAADWSRALMRRYPHADPARKVTARMGGSEPARFLICEDWARAWAPVRPEADLPPQVSLQPTHSRKRWDWIVDVIVNPPRPPFLAASAGLSGGDAAHWKLTTSQDLIVFGGAAALFEGEHVVLVERRRFLEAADWFALTGANAADLLRSHEIARQFRMGLIGGAEARLALGRLKTDPALLRGFPGSASGFLARLAAFTAQTRPRGKIAA